MNVPLCVEKRTDEYAKKLEAFSPKIARMYKKCYVNTLETAAVPMDDGSYFILTGDIPAMWLRDSTAEVSHYIPLAKENRSHYMRHSTEFQPWHMLGDSYRRYNEALYLRELD